MPIYFNLLIELMSVFVALFCYRQLRHSFNKWFLPFLVFIFTGEMTALLISQPNNIPVHYVISTGESVFYGYLFYRLANKKWLQGFILLFSIGIVLFFMYGFCFHLYDYRFYMPLLVTSGFFLSLVSLLYLYERFNKDDTELNKQPGFWVAFGVSVFFSGSSLVFILHDVIERENLEFLGFKLHWLVPQVLSVFLYACISISIVLNKNNNTSNRAGDLKTG